MSIANLESDKFCVLRQADSWFAVPAGRILDLQAGLRGSDTRHPLTELDGKESAWRIPTDAAGLGLVGGLLVRNGKVLEGLVYLEQAAEKEPQSAEIQYEIGAAYDRQRSHEPAIAAFRKANATSF